jgi:hypothetical protein
MTVAKSKAKALVPEIDEERDLELENIVGNLCVAQYQVEKLRNRLSERIGGFGSRANNKQSTVMFKNSGKWYKISINVDELSLSTDNTSDT